MTTEDQYQTIKVLPIALMFDEEAKLRELIAARLKKARAKKAR